MSANIGRFQIFSFVLAVAGMLALTLPAGASHVTRESVPIATGPGGQYDPAIKGDAIAYTDTSIPANGADIVVHSISTVTTERITGPGDVGAQEVEDIDGNLVVFRQWGTTDTEGEIYVYNLATDGYTPITDDAHEQLDPVISGSRIAWTQIEDFGAQTETSTIWMANVDGTGKQAIAPGGYQIDPAISGNTVVWYEAGNVVAVDITVPATPVQTTVATGADRWPDVHGTKIAYAAGGDIYLRDGATTTQLTTDAASQRRPKVSDVLVAWENRVGGGDPDVLAWDSRSGTIETLAGGTGFQELHDLDGTSLAYTERSTDAAGDIYLIREVVDVVVPADVALEPSTINLKSKGAYVTVRLEFPPDRDPATVDVSTVTLQAIDPVTSAQLNVAPGAPTSVGDADGDGIADLTVRFDRAVVQSWFPFSADPATFRVEGEFLDETAFEGEATARVQG
jgi:hypothetical protein